MVDDITAKFGFDPIVIVARLIGYKVDVFIGDRFVRVYLLGKRRLCIDYLFVENTYRLNFGEESQKLFDIVDELRKYVFKVL